MKKMSTVCDLCGVEEPHTSDPDVYLSANIAARTVARRSVDICKSCRANGGVIHWIIDLDILEANYHGDAVSPGRIKAGKPEDD
jgi:hypothetical protein